MGPAGPASPSARNRATSAWSPGKSALLNLADRTSRSVPSAVSKRPRLVLVPPTSPARITASPSDRRAQVLEEPVERVVALGAEIQPQDLPPPLLQSSSVAVRLGADQPAEGVVGLRHGQILRGLVHELKEASGGRSPLMELAGRVKEAGAVAQGGREARLLVEEILDRPEQLGRPRAGREVRVDSE